MKFMNMQLESFHKFTTHKKNNEKQLFVWLPNASNCKLDR